VNQPIGNRIAMEINMNRFREYLGVRFTGFKEPSTPEAVASLESTFQIRFPADYVLFLTTINGGKPKPSSFVYPAWETSEWGQPNYDLTFYVPRPSPDEVELIHAIQEVMHSRSYHLK
jgi:hypothetical protein